MKHALEKDCGEQEGMMDVTRCPDANNDTQGGNAKKRAPESERGTVRKTYICRDRQGVPLPAYVRERKEREREPSLTTAVIGFPKLLLRPCCPSSLPFSASHLFLSRTLFLWLLYVIFLFYPLSRKGAASALFVTVKACFLPFICSPFMTQGRHG